MDVVMITNTMKYENNKRWEIHNLNQQKIGNPQVFENFFFEKKR
jgi:hypothetical protein